MESFVLTNTYALDGAPLRRPAAATLKEDTLDYNDLDDFDDDGADDMDASKQRCRELADRLSAMLGDGLPYDQGLALLREVEAHLKTLGGADPAGAEMDETIRFLRGDPGVNGAAVLQEARRARRAGRRRAPDPAGLSGDRLLEFLRK